MKLTEEELKHYYASRGIVATDLLSTDAIDLSELPPDAELREPNRSIALNILGCWNGLDPLSKIDAAQSTEERVLRPRRRSTILDIHIAAEAWCAWLMLGRIRGTEARREVMEKVGRGEIDPTIPRRTRRTRKVVDPQRQDVGAFLVPIHARLQARSITGVSRETTRERTSDGESVTTHRIRPTHD
jgi:hypothetical protein